MCIWGGQNRRLARALEPAGPVDGEIREGHAHRVLVLACQPMSTKTGHPVTLLLQFKQFT